jgi:hypothetical protein
MRENGKHLDAYRKIHPTLGASLPGMLYGYFRLRTAGAVLAIISSGEAHAEDGLASWEHVSVSVFPNAKRLPTWDEMSVVKDLFWRPNETVVQFHPANSEYVNHYDCLHLWRPTRYALILPPTIALAPSVTGR